MDRDEIEKGLKRLGELANEDGVTIDLAVYGGSAIALRWEFRRATRDVDIIMSGDAAYVHQVARKIAEEQGWPADWINDAVKGFASRQGQHELYKEYLHENGGIRVFIPTASYLLAMKCMAMRIDEPDGKTDVDDIKSLIAEVGIRGKDELYDLVESYYPKDQISPKVYYGIEQIVNEISHEKNGNPISKKPPSLSR
jgi:hypothetical protein